MNEAVLAVSRFFEQPELVMEVSVTVLLPVLVSNPAGTMNVPDDVPMLTVAVSPVEVLAPERL